MGTDYKKIDGGVYDNLDVSIRKALNDIVEDLKENPFAYCHEQIRKYIDVAIFIDTPLDIALARRILRDMGNASGEDIRNDLLGYLKYARIAFVQMQKDILLSSNYVIDGTLSTEAIVENIINIII